MKYLFRRPLFVCGIISFGICLLGFYSHRAILAVGLFLLILLFVAILLKKPAATTISIFLLFLVCLSLFLNFLHIDTVSELDGTTVEGTFLVTEEPVPHAYYSSVYYTAVFKTIDCKELKHGERIWVTRISEKLETGNLLSAKIALSLPKETYQQRRYAEKEYLSGQILEETLKKRDGSLMLCWVRKLRTYINNLLFENMGYREAATLSAILTGNKSFLSDSFYNLVKAAGVAHVMVVSGMHLVTVVSMVSQFANTMGSKPVFRMLTVFLTVSFIALLCGFTKSILRAGFCYLLYEMSILVNRDNTPENTLGGAVLLLLIFSPFSVFSISFQLSVCSTFGIVAFGMPIMQYHKEKGVLHSHISQMIGNSAMITFSAMLFTLPISISAFGYFSAVSLFANIFVSQAVTLALILGVCALVLAWIFPFAASAFFFIPNFIMQYVNYVIAFFGGLPFATVSAGKGTLTVSLFLLFGCITALFIYRYCLVVKRRKELKEKVCKETAPRFRIK